MHTIDHKQKQQQEKLTPISFELKNINGISIEFKFKRNLSSR